MTLPARCWSVVHSAVSAVHVFTGARAAIVFGLLALLVPIHTKGQSGAPDAPEGSSFPVPTYPEDANWRQPDAYKGPGQPTQQIVTVDDRAQIFVDNYLIAESRNLLRSLQKPQKYDGNPILPADKPWENGQLAFPSVHFIDGRFHMWYLAHGLNKPLRRDEASLADSSFLCYATSRDGLHWKKPTLGHIEFRGSRENNIARRHEGSHFDSFSVFYDADEAYPYKMLLYQGTWPYKQELIKAKGYEFGIEKHGHYPFQSKDGIQWEYMQEKLEPAWRFDRSNAAYDTQRDLYIGLWKAGYRGVRSRKYAESQDLVNWSSARWLLIPQWLKDRDSKVDPAGTHFYGHSIFNHGTLYLGILEILNNNDHRMHLQLMSSRDLIHWNRMSAPEPFIKHGEKGDWDGGLLMMAGTPPVRYDNQLWFYYDGANHDHGPGEQDQRHIGLARLPVDRFAALQPDDSSRDGTLATVPLKLDGDTIRINADARQGMVKLELLDESGKVIPGFSRDECEGLILKDGVNHPIRWKSENPLPNAAVRIRFVLTEAKLFSLRVE